MDENPDKRITSDCELIKGIIAGSEGAVNSLYQKHHPKFHRYGKNFLSKNGCNSPDFHSGEVDNKSWFDGLRKINMLENHDRFVPWMYTIIKREALHHLKSCAEGWLSIDDVPDLPDYRIVPTDRLLEDAQRADAILMTARSISSKFGMIFKLHDVDEKSLKEIAADLGETYVNVRNIYFRGRKRLQEMLAA